MLVWFLREKVLQLEFAIVKYGLTIFLYYIFALYNEVILC
jgi:hypothetical protein